MSHGTGHRVGGGNQTERRVPSAGISQGGENSPAQCEHRPGAETLETRALESRRQQGRLCGSAPRGDLSFLLQVLLKAGNSVTASLARDARLRRPVLRSLGQRVFPGASFCAFLCPGFLL